MKFSTIALFIALLLPVTATAGVTFVSTDDELNQALVMFDKGEIESIAVSQAFYLGSAKQTKDRIRGLLVGLTGSAGKGIYLYGASLDTALSSTLIGDTSSVGCGATVYVGRFWSHYGGGAMCGVQGNYAYTEARIRERIVEQDSSNRRN